MVAVLVLVLVVLYYAVLDPSLHMGHQRFAAPTSQTWVFTMYQKCSYVNVQNVIATNLYIRLFLLLHYSYKIMLQMVVRDFWPNPIESMDESNPWSTWGEYSLQRFWCGDGHFVQRTVDCVASRRRRRTLAWRGKENWADVPLTWL